MPSTYKMKIEFYTLEVNGPSSLTNDLWSGKYESLEAGKSAVEKVLPKWLDMYQNKWNHNLEIAMHGETRSGGYRWQYVFSSDDFLELVQIFIRKDFIMIKEGR